eukprot:COSAG06_NODE_44202_length_365_cov_1.056391_1_plen_107_part_10
MNFATIFLVYPQVSLVVFKGSWQTCRQAGPSESYLAVDLSISCEDDDYQTFTKAEPTLALIALIIVVWVTATTTSQTHCQCCQDHRSIWLGRILQHRHTVRLLPVGL